MTMTTNDSRVIIDMIQTCDLIPSEDTTRRILEICESLNARIDQLNRTVRVQTPNGMLPLAEAIRAWPTATLILKP